MKKLLFTLFLSLLTLTMSAQIQRTFLGNTLCESTYEQVKNNMAQKGYRMIETQEGVSADFDNIKFSGYDCKTAIFNFYENKLYFVTFILGQSSQKEFINSKMEELRTDLTDKYAQYFDSDEDDILSFVDGNTFITASRSFVEKDNLYLIILNYFDIKLFQEAKKTNNE